MSEQFLRSLLEHYSLSIQDLSKRSLPRSFSSLTTPDSLADFKAVISRIEKAIERNERTVIYGDYDVDGLTSTAIMKIALDERGLNPGYFIPSRYVEGYGLNENRVRQFHEKGYHLIIAVDNGVSAFSAIDLAKSFGMEVIVIDHHEIDHLSDGILVFHHLKSGFLDYNCSAASLCYFVAKSLLNRDDEYLATLAGLAVFSDVMPMRENNLTMVKIMLSALKKHRYMNLVSLLNDPDKIIEYDDIPYTIVPVLNSIGRVMQDSLSTNKACRFLIEKENNALIHKYSLEFKKINEMKKEDVKKAKEISSYHLESKHSYVAVYEMKSGLSGLLSNRIMKEKDKATLIFVSDEKDESQLVGSIRLPKGYDGLPFLTICKKQIKQGGGHHLALGITIEKKDYFQVATLFSTFIEGQGDVHKKDDSIEITLDDLNKENYDIYQRFFPFGQEFEEPTFSLIIEKENLHLFPSKKAMYASNGMHGKVLCFSSMDLLESNMYESFTLTGKFSSETFRNETTYVLKADTIIGNIS